MSLDKFGRYKSGVGSGNLTKGPKGDGFRFTKEGNYDINNKKLCNVAKATEPTDGINYENLNTEIDKIKQYVLDLENKLDKIDTDMKTFIQETKTIVVGINRKIEDNFFQFQQFKNDLYSRLSKIYIPVPRTVVVDQPIGEQQ